MEHYDIPHLQRLFQGVSLFPLLFNLAINPLLSFLSVSNHCGYSAQLFSANTSNLPPTNVPIYVFWSDASDDSPAGWYRASVSSYHCDGSCSLHYDNGDTEQSVDLRLIEWCYAGRCRKIYRVDKPTNSHPPPLISADAAKAKVCSSTLHKAKGFADEFNSYF